MTRFDFRLRFHLCNSGRINCDQEELEVLTQPGGIRVRLTTGALGTSIKANTRAAIIGGPYSSAEDAQGAAVRAKTALLMWAVQQRLGIDVGGRQATGAITEFGRQWIENQVGVPVRRDIHGIDVYEAQDNQRFVSAEPTFEVPKSQEDFIGQFRAGFLGAPALSEKEQLATELYCASFFDVSFLSRFITLVTAVEALLQPQDRSAEARSLVEAMEKLTEHSGLENEVKQAIRGSLQWLKQESIGQAGRALVSRLLDAREYGGLPAPRFFSHCYDLRSQILHTGTPKNAGVNLLEEANCCQAFVADLLMASFQSKGV
jgi:hypothetical protein